MTLVAGRQDCTLNREGRQRMSFTRMQRPISVAMLQCSTVGVKFTLSGTLSLPMVLWYGSSMHASVLGGHASHHAGLT